MVEQNDGSLDAFIAMAIEKRKAAKAREARAPITAAQKMQRQARKAAEDQETQRQQRFRERVELAQNMRDDARQAASYLTDQGVRPPTQIKVNSRTSFFGLHVNKIIGVWIADSWIESTPVERRSYGSVEWGAHEETKAIALDKEGGLYSCQLLPGNVWGIAEGLADAELVRQGTRSSTTLVPKRSAWQEKLANFVAKQIVR